MIACLTPTKNESWVIACTGERNSLFFDKIFYYDQLSNDDTKELISHINNSELHINNSIEFNEAQRQLDLIEIARINKSKAFFALDADEFLIGNPDLFRSTIDRAKPGQSIYLEWINITPDLKYFWSAGYKRFGFIDDGTEHTPTLFHSERVPSGFEDIFIEDFKVVHLQYINRIAFCNKHINYVKLELDLDENANRISLYRKYSHMVYSKKSLIKSNNYLNEIFTNNLKLPINLNPSTILDNNVNFINLLKNNNELILLVLFSKIFLFAGLTNYILNFERSIKYKFFSLIFDWLLSPPASFIKRLIFKFMLIEFKK